MSSVTIIDTFPEFLAYWSVAHDRNLEDQIEQWHSVYMANWPALRQLQIDDYNTTNYNWRQIAREKVFPYLNQRLPNMQQAHQNLLENCEQLFSQVIHHIEMDLDIVIVIYVGIGCGAGWVTRYADKLAVLFGLENIAECGYETNPILSGLITHEYGHVVHYEKRIADGLELGSGPWWQLYSEGFAQYTEHIVMGKDLWHMKVTSSEDDWLEWCRENRAWLAEEYLNTVDAGEPVNAFFGSWFNIGGHSQTGYYLGHEVIRAMAAELPLSSIALSTEPDYGMRSVLEKFRDDSI